MIFLWSWNLVQLHTYHCEELWCLIGFSINCPYLNRTRGRNWEWLDYYEGCFSGGDCENDLWWSWTVACFTTFGASLSTWKSFNAPEVNIVFCFIKRKRKRSTTIACLHFHLFYLLIYQCTYLNNKCLHNHRFIGIDYYMMTLLAHTTPLHFSMSLTLYVIGSYLPSYVCMDAVFLYLSFSFLYFSWIMIKILVM